MPALLPIQTPIVLCRLTVAMLLLCLTGVAAPGQSAPEAATPAGMFTVRVRSSGQVGGYGTYVQLYKADATSYHGISAVVLPSPVPADKNGNVNIPIPTDCGPTALYYLVATNSLGTSQARMTAAGSCAALSRAPVVVNEVTTVASVYALSGFMESLYSVSADATVGTDFGTSLALHGITNAFAAVSNLVDIHTGVARAVTPAGNGTVPQAKIDSLANILAACIQSSAASAPCNGLLSNAPSLTGKAPGDTVQAMLNIAHNPGANIAALYALAPATPYIPVLTAVPNDLALSVVYTGTGTGTYQSLAADGRGHIWVTADSTTDAGSVVQFNPEGKVLSTYTGGTTGISAPRGIAIDPMNNIWVENCGSACGTTSEFPSLTKIAANGSSIQSFPQTPGHVFSPNALASDGAGNIYTGILMTTATTQSAVEKYTNEGVPAGGNFPLASVGGSAFSLSFDGFGNLGVLTGGDEVLVYTPAGVLNRTILLYSQFGGGPQLNYFDTAFDHIGNLFGVGNAFYEPAGKTFNRFFEIQPGAASATQSDEGSVGGLDYAKAVVVDGAGTQWIANGFTTDVAAFTSTGATFSPNSPPPQPPFFSPSTQGGFQAGFSQGSLTIAVDVSGNVWIADQTGTKLAEFVGAGTPVTPLAVGVRHNTVGQRP